MATPASLPPVRAHDLPGRPAEPDEPGLPVGTVLRLAPLSDGRLVAGSAGLSRRAHRLALFEPGGTAGGRTHPGVLAPAAAPARGPPPPPPPPAPRRPPGGPP